jgi:ribose transport system ATP-binding protein
MFAPEQPKVGSHSTGQQATPASRGTLPTVKPPSPEAVGAEDSVLDVRGLGKSFGSTRALDDVELQVNPGEIVAVVGHNGAGKTTLAKVIAGLVVRDQGTLILNRHVMPPRYSITEAREHGLALAMQEISLCPDLRVDENVVVAHRELLRPRWRSRVRLLIESTLSTIFPGNGISPTAVVANLSLAQRQMVQVALAAVNVGPRLRLLILDEPTSALTGEFAEGLFDYLHAARREDGLSVLLVSHKMGQVVGHADRTLVMRDGHVAAEYSSGDVSIERMVEAMAGGRVTSLAAASTSATGSGGALSDAGSAGRDPLTITDLSWRGLHGVSLEVRSGQIIGLAGLEGNGQRQVLEAVWRAQHRRLGSFRFRHRVRLQGRVSFVSGDRQGEGLFTLWSLCENLTASVLRRLTVLKVLSRRAERREGLKWIDRLEIRGSLFSPILALSGGTQQKVVLARALATRADLLLLDDPFRGVDIATKRTLYEALRVEAAGGRSVLWYTTENIELLECDLAYVLRDGSVVSTLSGDELTVERLIGSSFDATMEVKQ